MIGETKRGFMQFQDVRGFLDSVLSEDIHAKRVDSLANAAIGVMTGASLAVAMIGKSLAQARGSMSKRGEVGDGFRCQRWIGCSSSKGILWDEHAYPDPAPDHRRR